MILKMVYPNSVSPFNIVVSTGDGPTRLGNILKWILNIEGCLIRKSFEKIDKYINQYNKSKKNLLNKVTIRNFIKEFFRVYAG